MSRPAAPVRPPSPAGDAKPRVVIASFPHNPTTEVATPELMQRLVDLAREHEFILVHDFAYADIAFDGHVPPSVLQAEGALECAVELYSLTKSFSMAGWRMGFTLGRPDVLPATDFGVRKGFARLHGLANLPMPKELLAYGERWRPHRSTAAWYLWRAADLPE